MACLPGALSSQSYGNMDEPSFSVQISLNQFPFFLEILIRWIREFALRGFFTTVFSYSAPAGENIFGFWLTSTIFRAFVVVSFLSERE